MEILKINKKEKEVEFEVALAKKEWKEAQEKAIKSLVKTVRIPGFRPGCAPINMVKSKLEPSVIIQSALRNLGSSIFNFITESKKFEEADALEQILSQNVSKVTSDELEIKMVFEALPKIENFDLTKLSIEPFEDNNDYKVLVAQQIKNALKNEIMVTEKTNKTIANYDIAFIDFKGFIDNVAFENGEAKNFELEIGSKSFIGDFEQQLIGKKVGEEFSINVKFPKNYFKKEHSDKMARFDIKVNDVKEVNYPEMNADFFQKIGLPKFSSKKEFENYLENLLRKKQKNAYDEEAAMKINEQIIKMTKINYYPQSLIEEFKERIKQQYDQKAKNENLTFDQYLKKNKVSKADFDANVITNAQNNLLIALVYEQLMQKLKIELTKNDIEEHLKNLAEYFQSESKAKEAYEKSKDYIDTFILKNKLMDEIVKIASKSQKKEQNIKKETIKPPKAQPIK